MRLVVLLLLLAQHATSTSRILIDWSHTNPPDAIAYILDYLPPVGSPPAGSSFPAMTTSVLLNGTIPAAEYTVFISSVMRDGVRRNLTELTLFSPPDAPQLDSIETTEHEATISYFPPQGNDISYTIEYYPESQQEYSNTVETRSALVKLRGLDPGTQFRIKIRSMFRGVRSLDGIEASFRTQGEPNYDYSSAEAYSIRTLPPDFDLATSASRLTTEQASTTETLYSYEVSVEVSNDVTTPRSSTADSTLSTSTSRYVGTTSAPTTVRSTSSSSTSKTEKSKEIDTGDYPNAEANVPPLEIMKSDYGEPGEIELSDEDNMIRLDWSPPEEAMCDAFFVNYTILSLSRPKSFSVGTSETFTLIKMFPDHELDIRVFCMLAGALSKTWWAYRIVHLSKPHPLEELKVVHVETDEFYVAKIELNWKWPAHHDFKYYKVMVSYSAGKGAAQELEVTEPGPVVLEKLEPSQLYHIVVRNVSTELLLTSKPLEIDQITPPLISSTLFPGKISSTAININFGDTDPEQARFDHYLLTFTGNNKNITKKVGMRDERSFTFTKLIPGKTYSFSLYTVYKGVKSRAVIEEVTTYPLKVNQLFPVVGSDYAVLYWDIENFADSECRFRLSYTADRLPSLSVELKGMSHHRFGGLQSDTYYTFTITVIMGIGKAAAESESEMITVHIPKGRPVPSVAKQGTRELLVEFERDIFTTLNGAVQNYAVIVTDDMKMHDDAYELKSYFDVREEEVWGAYRASPSDWNPFTSQSIRDASFVIGSDDCVRRSLDEPYCNGILRANAEYFVRIRAYMDTSVAVETEWVAANGNLASEDEKEEQKPRLPCYFYLNGCPKATSRLSLNLLPAVLLLLLH